MVLSKKSAFTLSEVMIALLIVSVIAVLVIPTLSKEMNKKARMSLLKNTVAEVSEVVQRELSRPGATDITMTNIVSDPKAFLAGFGSTSSEKAFADSYKKYSSSDSVEVVIPSNSATGQARAYLKNGVGIGVVNNLYGKDATGVIVDLTGADKPNIVGVDYFIFQISWNDGDGTHPGSVGAYLNGGTDQEESETTTSLKSYCAGGNAAACFRLVELSGYNPDYME